MLLIFLILLLIIKRNLINAKIIAITGSSGKTTLKTLLSKVLNNYGHTYHSPKSYNNHYGVPLSLSNMKLNEQYCVFELGMSKKGEINTLAKMVKPDIGIITNIGEAHLENFTSINEIAKAKSELINNISSGGYIVLNYDDKYYTFLKKIALDRKLKVISFGYSKKADVRFIYLKKNFIIVKYQNKNFKLYLNDHKKINILNLLCSFAILSILKLDYKEIIKKNEFFNSIEGRGKLYRIKRHNKIFNLIDESYNANPSSTSTAIEAFSKIKTNNKKYFILGDMLELGKKTKNYHKLISKQINNSNVDKAFTYGKNTLTTFKHLKKDKKGNILQNLNDFDFLMKDFIKNNDYIMIKGSNASGVKKSLKVLFWETKMLYNFLTSLAETYPAFFVFNFLTFRTGLALGTSLVIAFIIGGPLIKIFSKNQITGPIRMDGPIDHIVKKTGTPTMGGIIIVISMTVSTLLWSDLGNTYVWTLIFVSVFLAFLGFLDDFLKIKNKNSSGLNSKFKFLGQLVIGYIALLILTNFSDHEYLKNLYFPFLKDFVIDLGIVFIPFALFVIIGASNAVNLTDGLDGLATVPVMLVALSFTLISYLVGNIVFSEYLYIQFIPGAVKFQFFVER